MVTFARLYEEAWRKRPAQRDGLRAAVLARLASVLAARLGLDVSSLAVSRLVQAADTHPLVSTEQVAAWALGELPEDRLAAAHRLGQTLDALTALEAEFERSERHTSRKKTGSFFTPPETARVTIASSLHLLPAWTERARLLVCDPAVGGGAFLLEAARALVGRAIAAGQRESEAWSEVRIGLHGFDIAKIACAVSEVALWLAAADESFVPHPQLALCDALDADVLDRMPSGGFDWVIGNPPWVAFQGRAARPLPAPERAAYRKRFRSFQGYPTLHALFVERAAALAPHGTVALLLPSSLSDLDGYQNARICFTETHCPDEPLREYGQNAFPGVVQPCFGLVGRARTAPGIGSPRPWALVERARKEDQAAPLVPPRALERLHEMPKLPPELFRELGLQTNREITGRLLLRSPTPRTPFVLGLLEGRRVREFECLEPELFLHPERETLQRTKCLLRPAQTYAAVAFIVRQTAPFPIAAAHNGAVFRNSLLGGFVSAEFDRDLLLGLLNSALFRAFHVSGQRDARQAAFPQVKLSHLRKLPRPPADEVRRERVRRLAAAASRKRSLDAAARLELDAAVFELYGLAHEERTSVIEYLRARAPGALSAPRPRAGARSSG